MEELTLGCDDHARIRDLVFTANKKRLNSFLGFKSRKSSSEIGATCSEIAPSSPKACALLNLFRSVIYKDTNNPSEDSKENEDTIAVDDIFQALLMIDPSYITPWSALDEFASALPKYSGPVIPIAQCISSAEEFFLNTEFQFAPSLRYPGPKTIPRYVREIMVQFAEKLNFHSGTSEPVYYTLVSQLVHTTFTVCKGWSSDLFDAMVSAVYLQRPTHSKMKTWLKLVQLSQSIVSDIQAEKIAKIMMDEVCVTSIDTSSSQDVLAIISIAVNMANRSCTTTKDKKSSTDVGKFWRRSLFLTLYQVLLSQSNELYDQAEKKIMEGMTTWGAKSLKSWIAELIDDHSSSMITLNKTMIPPWFTCNFLSLCTEILRAEDKPIRSGLLNCIVNHNVEDLKVFEKYISDKECKSMLNFVLGDGKSYLCEEEIHEIYYRIDGTFDLQGSDAHNVKCLSACGILALQSLRLKESSKIHESPVKKRYPSDFLFSRARRLVNMADDIVTNTLDSHNVLHASTFAIVVRTVSYFEVPELRCSLEQRIKQGISEPSKLQNSYFATLRLITASALKIDSNDEWIDRRSQLIDMSLPFSHGTYLGCVLATIPLAQFRILSRSKELLAPLNSQWGSEIDQLEISEQQAESGVHHRTVDGMRGLLELIRSGRWMKNEVEAWFILSDLLVMDIPPLPFESRRWLLRTLTTGITDGVFSIDSLDHLLRAATIRISSFFVQDNTLSKIGHAQPRKIEEIKTLHRLIVLLLRSLASVNKYSESRHILLAEGRESFLRAILTYKNDRSSRYTHHDDVLKKYYSDKAMNVDSFTFCWLLFLKVNSYILGYSVAQNAKTDYLESSSRDQDTTFCHFANRIKDFEESELRLKIRPFGDYIDLLPSWLNADSDRAPFSEKQNSIEQSETTTPTLPWLDIILELLFLVPLPTRKSHDFNDPLPWKLITATGFLMSQMNPCLLSMETIKETAEPFLSISSLLVRKAIRLDCALSVIEDLLVPTVSYCRALHLNLETVDPSGCILMIGSLWNLYQAIASEKACVKIIEYLESKVSVNEEGCSQRDRDVFSLTSVHSESDVDEIVQKLRLSCLRAFLSCLSSISNSEESDLCISRSLIGGILGALTTDLRAGLNGNSGGLPRELYLTFCILIEECASLLFDQKKSQQDSSIFLLFKEVATNLANILTVIPLRDAALFRTTFILAAAVFPSLCRDLTRRSLCNPDSSTPIIGDEMFQFELVVFDQVLKDCVEILIRWSALREPYLIPWLDIAGPDHSDLKIDEGLDGIKYHVKSSEDAFDDAKAGNGDIPRFVHVPSPSRNHHKSSGRIRLNTKEVWSWALSCSLLGLEQKWLESERTIHTSNTIESSDLSQDWLEDWKKNFRARRVELRKSLVDTNRFFRTSPVLSQRGHNGNRVPLDMVATNLPSAPRSRLCCLIECVSRVLVYSAQRLNSFLCGGAKVLARDLSIFESMCCLSAWLFGDEDMDEDFLVGLFQWLAIVSRKRNRPPSESVSSRNFDTEELFRQVSMVATHVHKLYLTLKELQKQLRSHYAANEHCAFSKLIGIFFGEDTANEILSGIAVKIHSLQQVMPKEFQVNPLPDFPSSMAAETEIPVQNSQRSGRKRTRSGSMVPRCKSRTTRLRRKNRNKVVDIFMDLDGGMNSPRRNPTRDAYADLEDFLVEG
ncbi:unnamed protein product [Pseudo-nitzschia multistriata]|uniref:Uncharacterized protein n=1 Tax=Pseudo-nitzschia multistriata TaxID=183589 RepID=A0A448ZEA3_9STRA|nr:unnamed protein product [Pseudo-nitzschia multistriata]